MLLEAEPELARKLAHLTSVPGIGLTTAIVVVAENNGFVLIKNEQQLASYVGLDVVQCQGGPRPRLRAFLDGATCICASVPAGGEQDALQSAANGFMPTCWPTSPVVNPA